MVVFSLPLQDSVVLESAKFRSKVLRECGAAAQCSILCVLSLSMCLCYVLSSEPSSLSGVGGQQKEKLHAQMCPAPGRKIWKGEWVSTGSFLTPLSFSFGCYP